ncbi:hypothetical protein EGW08_002991 [Elysia chlorotica]|uniref:Lipocalin/cytosolic fatty-acid binding domain-containing protein n=1 Tax=Elysia chlorotica TaxID=188477 RepID=A0A3S1A2X4_ELYCH|nr:hypothetical protein EGW08_002991 [Elysia chlorotica]
MEAIFGTWKNKKGSEENMTAFMDACKIPEAARQVMLDREYEISYTKGATDKSMKVSVKVTNDSKLPEKSYEYELGKEFECDDIDGQHFKCTITWDGSKFVENYVDDKGTKMAIQREITPDGIMKFAMICLGVTASSTWEKKA